MLSVLIQRQRSGIHSRQCWHTVTVWAWPFFRAPFTLWVAMMDGHIWALLKGTLLFFLARNFEQSFWGKNFFYYTGCISKLLSFLYVCTINTLKNCISYKTIITVLWQFMAIADITENIKKIISQPWFICKCWYTS